MHVDGISSGQGSTCGVAWFDGKKGWMNDTIGVRMADYGLTGHESITTTVTPSGMGTS